MERNKRIYRITILGSIISVFLLILKFIAGILGHSSAMIADAVHSLSDFITDIMVIIFIKISTKPADERHDYGHGKYETLATSLISIILMIVGVMIGWNGILEIIDFIKGKPQQPPEIIAFYAALISIALKEWIFIATKKVANEVNSQTLVANAWHHRSDALSSVGTAIGIGGAVLLGNNWAVLDPIAAIIVSVMIIITAIHLLRHTSGELLEESLPKETEDKIVEIVYRDKLASDVHKLHTRRIGNIIAIEMHLRLPGEITLEASHQHAKNIEKDLRTEFGDATHIMLHLEPTK